MGSLVCVFSLAVHSIPTVGQDLGADNLAVKYISHIQTIPLCTTLPASFPLFYQYSLSLFCFPVTSAWLCYYLPVRCCPPWYHTPLSVLLPLHVFVARISALLNCFWGRCMAYSRQPRTLFLSVQGLRGLPSSGSELGKQKGHPSPRGH